jgi:hypothetical protein
MKASTIIFVVFLFIILAGCSGDSNQQAVDPGLRDTGQEFNPYKWYGKNRIDMGKLLPEISNIDKSVSGGPFALTHKMGVKEVGFTFENSERDARLLNVLVLFAESVTLNQAQKKFGVDLSGLVPQKTKRFWHFAIQKPMIHGFMVDLKPADADCTRFSRAWISYRLN